MLNITLFSLLRPANRFQGIIFSRLVKQGNREGLRNLVRNEYPGVAWGKYFRRLVIPEQEWALATIARLN